MVVVTYLPGSQFVRCLVFQSLSLAVPSSLAYIAAGRGGRERGRDMREMREREREMCVFAAVFPKRHFPQRRRSRVQLCTFALRLIL